MSQAIPFEALHVTGKDAQTFLQGQLTCDVALVNDQPSFGAYCDHKGRVLVNFIISTIDQGYRLCLPRGMLKVTKEALHKYGAFSQVSLRPHDVDMTTLDVTTDRVQLIEKKLAYIFPETSLCFTPQMIGWQLHGGVSFDKGCYLGQEIVARTEHLGKLKRHLKMFSLADINQCPSPGDKLFNKENQAIGLVCDAVLQGNQIIGLAVIEDRALETEISWQGTTNSHAVLIVGKE